MLGTRYLCAFYVTTAGVQGALLGSDEQQLILLVYVVIDMSRNQTVGTKQYIVKPVPNDLNETMLSEEVIAETTMTEELVKKAGVPLEVAIKQFDIFIRSMKIDPTSPVFRLVTDGQLPLRQCLHPEASSKNINLPDYYNVFHDLRKDFRTFYNVPNDQELSSITHLVKYLAMTHDHDPQFHAPDVKDMVTIIQRLISDGHCFSTPETIDIKLEPGICWKDEEVDNNCVVRARGLPWQSSDQDIAKFFRGLNVAKGGVALCLSPQGRRNGEALVRFVSQEHRDMALKRHKHHIGNRYIEVYKASGEDFVNVAGGNNNEAQAFLTRGAQVIVRMRGLPYDCSAKQVMEFFEAGGEAKSCKVMDAEEGVLFVKKLDGRATGDAFVLFAKEEDAQKALSKHRELIGTRYIELFRSTTAEVQQVLNRCMDPKTYETPQGQSQSQSTTQLPNLAPLTMAYLPQHMITSGVLKDCIRLRGLPYEALVEHILEFLGEHAKNIVFQGVHMVVNAEGQPSGDAFIQMNNEQSAFAAAASRHRHYMYFGKKPRYIEVFQCSGEDMNLFLTGCIPSGGPVSPVGKTLLSPGMLNTQTLVPATPPTASSLPTVVPVSAAGLLPQPSAASSVSWDPIATQVAAIQMQAIAQAQALRTQQEWLLNNLYVQQQQQQLQQQLQLATFGGKQSWPDINNQTLVQALSTQAALGTMNSAGTSKTKTIGQYPSTPFHMPQATTAAGNHPLLFINIPRVTGPAHGFQAKNNIGGGITNMVPQYTNSIANIKRSWDSAFPVTGVVDGSNHIKRQCTPQPGNNTSALFTLPPPQSQNSTLPSSTTQTMTFQPSQFYGHGPT